MNIPSYPKIYNIGHRAIAELFNGVVVVQEKVDGSQFSFGVYDGKLVMRSKGREVFYPSDDNNFALPIATVDALFNSGKLYEGWTYRGEAITRPKHNTLKYDRIPKNGLILFDIDVGNMNHMLPEDVKEIAEELDLECVNTMYIGEITSLDQFRGVLETESALGGTTIEGVVIKNYERFGIDGKTLMGKWVSEAFREKHGVDFKKRNPSGADVIVQIIETYRNQNRWEKAVQHLRDAGTLDESPRDIGGLITEIQNDVKEECEEEIKDMLFNYFWKKSIVRGITNGFPEWYKEKLMENQKFNF